MGIIEEKRLMGRATKALVSEHVRNLLQRYNGGEEISGDLAGFFVYEEMACLMGTYVERVSLETQYGERAAVVVEGMSDNVYPYEGEAAPLGGGRELGSPASPVRIRLLLTEGAEGKWDNAKNPIAIGDRLLFFVQAKLAAGNKADRTFWSTSLIVFRGEAALPPWEEVKMPRPRVDVPAAEGDGSAASAGSTTTPGVGPRVMSAAEVLARPGSGAALPPLREGETDPEDDNPPPPAETTRKATAPGGGGPSGGRPRPR